MKIYKEPNQYNVSKGLKTDLNEERNYYEQTATCK